MSVQKPYSDWVERAGWIYFSGKTGAGVDGAIPADFTGQATNAMSNSFTALRDADCDWRDVVKVTVFLTDMKDYQSFNAIYLKFFGNEFPARSCVAVADLPRSAKIEVEVVAYRATASIEHS
ncbi:RidA family protein [Cupriavidus basilensis]|uniref:Endoribonuclease L-PSP n=1 Tax=Cupriavidus basilensis TaxID=68895 RepID=A0A0C4YSC3_9BURK|nr:RidA family protein [Cupriavidus basilensis]AJG23521.1 Endoribonuclease L-PSP [Cupriavidus basilensis]